jgi:putative glutamine amidotransferase
MVQDHRHLIHELLIESDVDRLGLSSDRITSSCYHHQAIEKLGEGLRVIASAAEGHPEAFSIENDAWAYAVQWHPEDNSATDAHQAELFKRFIEEAAAAKPI